MQHKIIISVFLTIMLILVALSTPLDAYYGYIPALSGLYGGIYGLYGIGGLYGLGNQGILNYLGYLYGVYGNDIQGIYANPAGLNPNIWAGYGITYHPLLGYYQPLNLFDNLFLMTNLLSWW